MLSSLVSIRSLFISNLVIYKSITSTLLYQFTSCIGKVVCSQTRRPIVLSVYASPLSGAPIRRPPHRWAHCPRLLPLFLRLPLVPVPVLDLMLRQGVGLARWLACSHGPCDVWARRG